MSKNVKTTNARTSNTVDMMLDDVKKALRETDQRRVELRRILRTLSRLKEEGRLELILAETRE